MLVNSCLLAACRGTVVMLPDALGAFTADCNLILVSVTPHESECQDLFM